MMATDCSNNAAARAGSVMVCGVGFFALELARGRSMHLQFTLLRTAARAHKARGDLRQNHMMGFNADDVYSLCHDLYLWNSISRTSGAAFGQLFECLRDALA
jgi:hypothetical protein